MTNHSAAKFTKLETLTLNHTNVRDLPPLARLKNLRELSLFNAPVEDVTPLTSLSQQETLPLGKSESPILLR